MSGKLGKEWWWRLGRRTCEANFPCILLSSRRLTWRSNLDGWTSLLRGRNSWPRCNFSPHVVIYQLRNDNNKKERNFRGIYQGSCATRLVRTGHPLLTFFMALISGGQAQSRPELLGFIKFGGLEIEIEQDAGWCQNKDVHGKWFGHLKRGVDGVCVFYDGQQRSWPQLEQEKETVCDMFENDEIQAEKNFLLRHLDKRKTLPNQHLISARLVTTSMGMPSCNPCALCISACSQVWLSLYHSICFVLFGRTIQALNWRIRQKSTLPVGWII